MLSGADGADKTALLERFSTFAQAPFTTSRPGFFSARAGLGHRLAESGRVTPEPGS